MDLFSSLRCATLIALLGATPAGASDSKPIDWADLMDQSAQTFDDPYRDLTYDQIDDLREIVAETSKIEQGGLGGDTNAQSESRIEEARERLAQDGIDADWLVAQRWVVAERREKAATSANSNLDGQTVSLAGFAIPAPADEDGAQVVYLVPARGMCSHMPPPNANQMIRARINSDWRPSMMHEPVRLSGTLSVQETNQSFRVVDGDVQMRSSFVLDVSRVETMQDLRADSEASSEWATSLVKRLRASGQLPIQQQGTGD
ncbi:MAG: DUF3299 domain-containing protein [Sedimentitalea sp.]|uniref:DUF3299 domain-containing protein n=1 Tax=Sedimentitalea sp. TaxID=2048915 RepID=UPI00326798C4